MQPSSFPVTFAFYKRFLQVKYFLIFGFVSGLILTSLFIPIIFDAINNLKIWGWVLFTTSFLCFLFYYLFLVFFWRSGNLKLAPFKNTLISILVSVVVLLLIEVVCLLVIYQVFDLGVRTVFLVTFPMVTIAMFVGVSLSTKFFFNWQKTVLSPPKTTPTK